MPKSANQKLKLLYLLQILQRETNEEHRLNTQQLIERLSAYDISCERKSLYDDIDCLRRFGVDIIYRKDDPSGYYVGERVFELPELKLLVDAVQSARFITIRKSNELIAKLEQLTNRYEAQQLQCQVQVYNRVKTNNEKIFYSVDDLHTAIAGSIVIHFQYMEWTTDKRLVPRHNGRNYTVSPLALCWENENYYLVAIDRDADEIHNYRVDKIASVVLTDTTFTLSGKYQDFHIAEYCSRTFGMFGGTDRRVVLLCDNAVIGVIMDRFGTETTILKEDNGHFKAYLNITESQQFYGWIAGLGGKVTIAAPESTVNGYIQYLRNLLDGMAVPV